MGNKTTTKKTTTVKRAAAKAAPKAVSDNTITAPTSVTKPKRSKATGPDGAKKPTAPKRTRKKAVAMANNFTVEDIAMRAYYIAEKRQQTGEFGTPEGDWLEAERQLAAELAG